MAINKATNLVNHVVFLLDESGSMRPLTNSVVKLFDNQVKNLCKISVEKNQETRVSVFTFATTGWMRTPNIKCIVYDTDVLRVPSINSMYTPNGGTPLIDGVINTIDDLLLICQKFGDHAFLLLTITDGEETERKNSGHILNRTLTNLPENWTIACLVPSECALTEAVYYGFPIENCQLWETTEVGLEKMNTVFKQATETFMHTRSTGVRGMKSGLFKVDLSKIDKKEVQKELEFVPFSDLNISTVKPGLIKENYEIRNYVENVLGITPYVKGKGFYQLTKKETVQSYKKICVRHKVNGNIYTGDAARKLIQLPNVEIDVKPDAKGDYDIFVESTSYNRKLVPNTRFIYLLK